METRIMTKVGWCQGLGCEDCITQKNLSTGMDSYCCRRRDEDSGVRIFLSEKNYEQRGLMEDVDCPYRKTIVLCDRLEKL